MAVQSEVSCINKNNRTSPFERINNIGGMEPKPWKLELDEAIRRLEAGIQTFYVIDRSRRKVAVVVARSSSGRKYLKTEADGAEPNNLLSLPECP